MYIQTKTEYVLESLVKRKFITINKIEKERKTYDINKTSIETKLSSQSILNQVVSRNNKLVSKMNLTAEESERKYNNYNEQLEQLYARKSREQDTINKQYEIEIKRAEEKRDRLLEKVENDSSKYETYLIKEKEKLEKKTEILLTDLSANIIEPTNNLDEDKYPILTKSKETIKQLEDELESIEKEILEKESIRQTEVEARIKEEKYQYDMKIRQEEIEEQKQKNILIEQKRQEREAIKKKDEERWEQQKLEKLNVIEEKGTYISKEEQNKIHRENINIWNKNILSQLPPEYTTIFSRCGEDRKTVCYNYNDPITLKEYIDGFKSKIEKMIALDEIAWNEEKSIEYFNDSAIWDIWKALPVRIQMAVADLDTKEKQLKLIKSSKSLAVKPW